MSEVYVRGYDKTESAGHRYAGDCMLEDGELVDALAHFWTHYNSSGKFLVISGKPLGEKRRTLQMRKEA